MEIDQKGKLYLKRERKVIKGNKENKINEKIAEKALDIKILIKMKDLLNIHIKGNEFKRELKQRMKDSEAKINLIRGEKRTRPLIKVDIDGSKVNALCDIRADISTISQDIFEQL